jgi:hypothetical protein
METLDITLTEDLQALLEDEEELETDVSEKLITQPQTSLKGKEESETGVLENPITEPSLEKSTKTYPDLTDINRGPQIGSAYVNEELNLIGTYTARSYSFVKNMKRVQSFMADIPVDKDVSSEELPYLL